VWQLVTQVQRQAKHPQTHCQAIQAPQKEATRAPANGKIKNILLALVAGISAFKNLIFSTISIISTCIALYSASEDTAKWHFTNFVLYCMTTVQPNDGLIH